ncbi:TetR/AcrR family transcriptional regulator [Agreia pratensis]|uniref:Transcriptional regulator, TetR family n=1 Tax=Agreia pratensis TaxID=150121 RepID=A0A1X7JD40_9MICO|nr:TetR/AcrR family transcriptional regulator [Agreia pratensis]SMG25311.1 transcriptional regulator, TetR family [Agreia pratensis]
MARTREFDDEVLRSASRELFWSNGFANTSVGDISAATKVGNGSIYAAYGSKFDLFFTILESYCRTRIDTVASAMSVGRTAEESIREFFDVIVADCAGQVDRRGCLMLNSIAEFGGRDDRVMALCRTTTDTMEQRVAERIQAAISSNEIDAVDIDMLAAQIILVSQGLIQMSRLGTSREKLAAVADSYIETLPLNPSALASG